ncbi:MAG: helix-turn-helix transcriptional regulator [Gammaproteobacteria bacterium]|jgi:AraC-like DNA-binding protein|nr:helix-turn-helix transcriptional regulator [Gammaproteobacteria bacterium]MBU0770789.1 helix-turn-helix transcriptional regulator [Gammaproteobacteria bacterium]MBU0857163.1 helix-turn-helix transcriptional regulator [Gammaproteobacteria bacterium]MBU1846758.1 helix-turn-helix transcriptional regulator [Gammaproteobacteria bacterium]
MSSTTQVRDTHFDNARLSEIGIEVLSLHELRNRVRADRLAEPERVDFLIVLMISQGSGEHLIDFRSVRLVPGSAVVVRPGQVQQWRMHAGLQGLLLLVDTRLAQLAASALANPAFQLLQVDEWPATFALSEDDQCDGEALARVLERQLNRDRVDDVSASLARELFLSLMVLLSRAARVAAPARTTQERLFQRLQRDLDASVRTRPTVADIARRLRVSPSTLSRVCRLRAGVSAKELIDRRTALEAQRLLVHTGATTTSIGEELGFSEPTNFLKFFKRVVGMTPDSFRRTWRPVA